MVLLKAADILQVAMQVEQSGEVFYRAVAQKVQSPEAQALFEDLAQQEVKHFHIFSSLAKAVRDKPMMTTDEWDEYQGYLGATVQSAFFEGPDRALALAEEVTDEKEALRMAMSFEKETLLFFYDLRDIVPDSSRKAIQRVVAEEKSHIQRLAGILRDLG